MIHDVGKIGHHTANEFALRSPLTDIVDLMEEQSPEYWKRQIRIARLAMLIECEGSITIGMTPPTKTRNRPSLSPMVAITNTNTKIIDEARDVLIDESIGFCLRPIRYGKGFGKKWRQDINISGFERTEKILTTILPFLNAKKTQAVLVMEFIASRKQSSGRAMYSDREWRITTDIRKLNGRKANRRSLEKSLLYLNSEESENHPRAKEYFRKYVEMCSELNEELRRKEFS